MSIILSGNQRKRNNALHKTTELLENLLPLYGITDTGVQKLTQLCSKIVLMHVNGLFPMLFVKDLVTKKGRNLFGKRSKSISSAKVIILKT